MLAVELLKTIQAPWTDMEPVRVGRVSAGGGTPGVYATIKRDGEPYVRVDAWPSHGGPFVECIIWREYVALGWGSSAHVIHPATRDVRSIDFKNYFGHFYPLSDKLLIASESDLTCLDVQRNLLWRSGGLGIDGVVVDCVDDDEVAGKGEWDPPGGWRSFRLSLISGQAIGS